MVDANARFDLTGKVALVTGGSRGLGRAMVLAFAGAGADVVIASRKLGVVRADRGRGPPPHGPARARPSPVTWASGRRSKPSAERTYREFGRIDVLVNNAGMSPVYDRIENVSEDLYDKVLDVNLKGPFRLTRPRRGSGWRPAPGLDHHGLQHRGRPPDARRDPLRRRQGRPARDDRRLRARLPTFGPGELHHARAIPHRHLQGLGHGGLPGPRADGHPLGRGGEADEIVGAALYFASSASSFTTGAVAGRARRCGVSDGAAVDGPEIAPVRRGEELDRRVLETWLRPRLRDVLGAAAASLEIQQFPNGSANLTYLLRFGPHELVLRRPPMGELAPGAHDMRREYKVLSRLWRQFDRAPRAYVFCDDSAVLGVDFFVMERRRGEVVRTRIPPRMQAHGDVGRRIGFALVDAMADLHTLEPDGLPAR